MVTSTTKDKRDWSKYNESLVNRGSLTLFVSKDFARDWYVRHDEKTPRKRGGQPKYTDAAILAMQSLRFLFHQPLRSIEGFVRSLVAMMKLDLEVPDYTTIALKFKEIKVKLPLIPRDRNGYVGSLDSTGFKIHGQGEWNRKKHKQTDRADWVKMHIAIDNESMEILAVETTADDVQDPEVFTSLIDALPGTPSTIMGDGAYDTFAAYERAHADGFDLIAPPRENAITYPNSDAPHVLARNTHVAYYQSKGMYAWANKNDYWQRNKVETTMSRFVTTFSDRISSRKVQSQKNEIILKCQILNILMAQNNVYQDSAA